MKSFLKFKNCNGIVFKVEFKKPDKRTWGEDCDGVCFTPENYKSKIYINPHRSNQTQLNTIIHEVTHAYFPDKAEYEVLAFGNTLSRLLYNDLKWRKREDT